jgi:uncharacterized protein YyaL (SSP411 family)
MSTLSALLRGAATVAAALALAQVLRAASPAAPASPPAPGGTTYPAELQERLRAAALAESGPPRTRHRRADGRAIFTNRLILEPSPYLRQHAHNPVDWYPWGDEAFARARAEHKPVLLSVGYSTCHWCHVMEEESFEDLEIAEYLNRNYVAIKVDRERRPDIDAVYMEAVQHMSGRGGWPMTVWLTPDRQPFYGGTYFPPRDGVRGAGAGFLTVLQRLREAYDERPDEVAAAAADVAAQVRGSLAASPGTELPGRAPLDRSVGVLRRQFDAANGGFGTAPKFPRSVQLQLLLRYHRRTGDADALKMATQTLQALAAGGIHDQIGGGFHRYSTDPRWLVPHFEKMLYDNALLALAYLDAYQVTGRAEFAGVARDILAYVRREMTAAEGGFYAASDADSTGVEGAFFVWTPAEMEAVLSPDEWRLARAYYAVSDEGNFAGKNVLHTPQPLSEVARATGVSPDAAEPLLRSARAKLYAARQQRVPPHTDRKILPAWNGLMISAFARGAQLLGDPADADSARRAAEYVLGRMTTGSGELQRSALDGQASGEAYLDDYAAMIGGLLDLYEATFDPRWLRAAIGYERVVEQRFRDTVNGAYFLSAADAEPLLARSKPDYDGGEPSANSIMLLDLLRLHELTGDDRYRERAAALLRAFATNLNQQPDALPAMLGGLDFWLDRPKEIVIAVPNNAGEAAPLLERLRGVYVPNRVVTVVSEEDRSALAQLAPIVADKVARGGRPTAYVCEQRSCELPTADPDVFARQLAKVVPLPE